MEIIKKGNKDLKYYYECTNCGTIFTLTAEERACTNSLLFHCPVCEADMSLNSGQTKEDYENWKKYKEQQKNIPEIIKGVESPDPKSSGYNPSDHWTLITSSDK